MKKNKPCPCGKIRSKGKGKGLGTGKGKVGPIGSPSKRVGKANRDKKKK